MSAAEVRRVGSLVAAFAMVGACSPAASAPALHLSSASWGPPPLGGEARAMPSLAEWRAARARLGELQRAAAAPRTLRISLTLREPATGRTLEARGAVALAPPDALRMILLGPGGTTALDLWLDRDRFRFAVPAIDLLRRGDATTPRAALRGLPIDFLRWWLLRPATGALLWAAREDGASRLLLREGAAMIDLRAADGGRIEASRATWAPASTNAPARLLDEETVTSDQIGCAPVRYQQASTGLFVTVRCEGEDRSPPNPKAFVDPDAAGDGGEVSGDACVIAIGAVSGLGVGAAAYSAGAPPAEAEVVIKLDPALGAAGLRRPFAARAAEELGAPSSGDRATDLLMLAFAQVEAELSLARPAFRSERIGVALGTSSGGMLTAERFFAARAAGAATADLARGATYFAPLDHALAALGLSSVEPRTHVLAACAASTVALGLALRWLDRGACDLVLAGGYDGLSVFVAAGFEALRATTASRPRPFRIGRDGMSLGEGAAVVALVREADARGVTVLARVAGFGASNDAIHITAPDRTGGGLLRAGAAALADAGVRPPEIDLVSAHATATPYNDAMESRAIAGLLGREAPAKAPPVHPFKAQIGHTLGAAGVLEALAAADALRRGVAPAAAGEGELDPDAPAVLLDRAEARPLGAALKLSAAFGGTNAALVLTAAPSGRRVKPPRRVFLHANAHVDAADLAALAEATGVPRDRLARLDALCRLGLGAVAALAGVAGRDALRGAGIVAGHGLATIDTNEGYDARKRARGAIAVEPRVFPATSPNAIVGECAIVYGLTGPSFSVSAGLDGATEALLDAALLIAAGDADRMVVVAADDAGPVAQDLIRLAGFCGRPLARGAVALLLTAAEAGALREVDLDLRPDHAGAAIGHLALLRWLGDRPKASATR